MLMIRFKINYRTFWGSYESSILRLLAYICVYNIYVCMYFMSYIKNSEGIKFKQGFYFFVCLLIMLSLAIACFLSLPYKEIARFSCGFFFFFFFSQVGLHTYFKWEQCFLKLFWPACLQMNEFQTKLLLKT